MTTNNKPGFVEYCLGFVFSSDNRVLLIRKARPEWMKDQWNGIGGKLEAEETPYHAMQRECQEETGLNIAFWDQFCTLYFPGYIIHCFVRFLMSRSYELGPKGKEDEPVEWMPLHGINIGNYYTVHNLKKLLDLALEFKEAKERP